MKLEGILKKIALAWYGPHLAGKCVPFDWVSFTAMLIYKRYPGLLTLETCELWVGEQDASVLVLKKPGSKESPAMRNNMQGTQLWGKVESLVGIDREAMLQLARLLSANLKA
jgi:hypothetical protein